MPKEPAMRITEIGKEGQEHLVGELDKGQALDYLAHVDAQYEAYRRSHPGKNLERLPPGEWEKYLDWAIQRLGDKNHA